MAALTEIRVNHRVGTGRRAGTYQFPVKAATKILQGAAVGVDPATGLAEPMAAAGTTLICFGCARFTADNSSGLAAAKEVTVDPGVFQMFSSGLGYGDVGKKAYASTDQDFVLTPGTKPVMGIIEFVESATVARVAIEPPDAYGSDLRDDLANPANGFGASLIALEDAGGFTSADDPEAALQELYQHLFSAVGGYVSIPLSAFREVSATGDVGDASANGGVLASDTTPVFDAVATSNEHEILWATGNVDPIGVSIALPRDFDDTANATLDLEVSSGSTDAATIGVASAWSAGAAGTEVSDSTSDAGTKSATPHRLSITIDAADIPAGARRVTFRLTPPAHATNAISLHAAGLAYKRKLLTS